MSSSLFGGRRKGTADEARSHHDNSLFTKLRQRPFVIRMGVVYCGSFLFGAMVEYFACSTGLYETVASKKADRRLEIDEFVADFRQNMEKWQQEDKERALRIAAAKQQLQQSAGAQAK